MEDVVSATGERSPFWQGRRVLLTGHTGFKGSWTALRLHQLGAQVHGFALAPDTTPSLWQQVGAGLLAGEVLADLSDRAALQRAVMQARPQLVLHMAAQPLVRASYADPVGTVATNVLGTVHLLDALRGSAGLEAVLVVTTDKVYANADTGRDFIETDPLGGDDPYSASKAAAEIVTRSYAASFFEATGVRLATARAGNVIGGGDWSADRLIPDIWRAMRSGQPLMLRYPEATRPWQHVVEPVFGYLSYLEALVAEAAPPRALNFGPRPSVPMTVAAIADTMSAALGVARAWQHDRGEHPHEMTLLSLDPALAAHSLGWHPRLDATAAVDWTARWYADHSAGADARTLCLAQLNAYEAIA